MRHEGLVHVHAHPELLPQHTNKLPRREIVPQIGLPGGAVGRGVEDVSVASVDAQTVGEGGVADSCEARSVH